ncbi:hypothetical protein I3843_12G130000 [Carya illinoinensis]|uniref:tetraacyldisaccharide 4'-kinase n=2 Tax=Carya illinoinensis TaxID=32201 RepID=A0A922DJT3_CARIL|nr:hypothetical protein I3760_12G127800 [Carya illinoinensis]KAG6685798.1 hypothetical protein I3842_12G130000 [Carya illinoinensis]KAG7953852.1 hypothetical protein I3843_12G130000 [Carya illinoinensis]
MEKLRVLVIEIAYSRNHTKLSPLQRSLIPVLSFASSLYRLALSLRHYLYHLGIFRKHRLPVPVISVGNLTWGGNGKTPMVEFIARWLVDSGISPLILTRGYAGGDEARMLGRHLLGGPAKIGVGANRAAVAAAYFEKYGYVDPRSSTSYQRLRLNKVESHLNSEKVGAVILDDGMQHWSLHHDLEVVMVNGLVLWGCCHLLPLGPLREPLTALKRADVAVIHHADMIGASFVDRLNFSDHHIFQARDVDLIRRRLEELEDKFGSKPVVVVTEKDYDRDAEILKGLYPFKVLVLCSALQFLSQKGCTEKGFKKLLEESLRKLKA